MFAYADMRMKHSVGARANLHVRSRAVTVWRLAVGLRFDTERDGMLVLGTKECARSRLRQLRSFPG